MFYLKIPHLYQQIHTVLKPSLALQAFAIYSKGIIWSVNKKAALEGITVGMTIRDAQKHFPQIVLVKKRSGQYAQFNAQLQKIIRRVCKPVHMVTLGSYYLSAEIPEQHAEYLAKKIREVILRELELNAYIGYGPTQTIAYAATQLASYTNPVVTVLSQNAEALQQLPCSCLSGIGKRTALMLFGMGIKTIKDFASLPIGFVSVLFGEKGKTLHNLANDMPLVSVQPLKPIMPSAFSFGQQAAF